MLEDRVPTAEEINDAIQRLGTSNLRERVEQVDGNEAHRVLPQIWPVIQEILVLADASKAGKLSVAA